MPTARLPRLLPGTPRWLLGLVAVLAAATATAALLPGGPDLVTAGAGDDLRRAPALALQLAVLALLGWRARTVVLERALWRRLAAAAAVLAASVLGTSLAAVLLPGAHGAQLLMAWAPAATFPLVYGGLVTWNRYSTTIADPNDSINGCSAVLAVVAVGNTVLAQTGAGGDRTWWLDQELLAHLATAFVVLGTALSIAFVAAITRDVRPWLLATGFTAEVAAAALGIVLQDHWLEWVGVAVAALCLSAAAVLRPPPSTPQPTDPAATTIGAFVVIVCSTAVLVVCALGQASPVAVCCAGLAAAGSAVRLLMNIRDLSQLAVSRKEALTDDLTGVANRRAVLRRVQQLGAGPDGFVLALLDLDKFKEVNDGLGHSAGDDLLRLVAQRLSPSLTSTDVLGRLGGDEFAVVGRVPRGRPAAAYAATFGDQLRRAFDEPFVVGGLTLHIAASVGVATSSGAPSSTARSQLLREADAAMYDAKRTGAGVRVYDPARHADSSGRLALVEEMRSGLAAGEFVLHHQPQVDIATGRTVGVEALVRWAHPTRGLLSPADFLPLAEVHGLMGPLTDCVLAQAVAQAAAWRRAGHRLRVSVNLSASNLLDTGLPARVAELLDTHGVPPRDIVLEVTETVLLSDPDRSLAVVAALAALGTTVSIDDFGTGYASLTYLRQLPVGELKLDRSFTADLLTDARAAAIVSSTIGLAHQLGLRVVGEGVEDPATLHDLRLLGCDESQGYLHARPLPAEEFERWLLGQDTGAVPALR